MKHQLRILYTCLITFSTYLFSESIEIPSYTTNVPHLGEVELRGTVDLASDNFHLTGKLPKQKLDIPGILSFSEPLLGVSSKTGLELTAKAKLLTLNATVGLRELTPKRLVLGIKPTPALHIPIIPGKYLSFKDVFLVLEKNQDAYLALMSGFAKSTVIGTIGAHKDDQNKWKTFAELAVDHFTFENLFGDLIKKFNIPQIKNIGFKNALLSIDDFASLYQTGKANPTIHLEGKVDLTSLNIASLPIDLQSVAFSTDINKENGIVLSITLENLDLGNAGHLNTGALIISSNPFTTPKKNIEVVLKGDGYVKLGKQKVRTEYLSHYKDGELPIKASIPSDFNLSESLNIKHPTIKLKEGFIIHDPIKQKYSIGGKGTIQGVKSTIKLTEEGNVVSIEASVDADHFTPLEIAKFVPGADKLFTYMPKEKVYSLRSATIGVKKAGALDEAQVWVEGKGTILGLPIKTRVRYERNQYGSGAILTGAVDEQWILSDSFPKLKGSPLDSTGIKDARILVSSFDFEVEDSSMLGTELKQYGEIEVKEGLNAFGFIELGDIRHTQKLSSILKEVKTNIITSLYVDAESFSFYGLLGTMANIPQSPIEGGSIGITARADASNFEAGYYVDATLVPDYTQRDIKLRLAGIAGVSALGLDISASIEGTWTNPYGFKGVSFGNLAGTIGIGWEGVPYKIGLTGDLTIGNLEMSASFLMSGDGDFVIAGKRENFDNQDILDIFNAVTKAHLSLDKFHLPYILIRKASLYMAPKNAEIGNIDYQRGFKINGELYVLKKTPPKNIRHEKSKLKDFNEFADNNKFFIVKGLMSIDDTGIKMKGYTNKIELKAGDLTIFELTGKGPDKKYGTSDDGPEVDLEIDLHNPHLYTSGKIKIPGMEAEGMADISATSLKFEVNRALFGIKGKVRGEMTGGFNNPDLEVTLMADSSDFEKAIIDGINNATNILSKGSTDALERQRDALKRKLNEAKQHAGQEYDHNLKLAQSAFKSLEHEINKVKKLFP